LYYFYRKYSGNFPCQMELFGFRLDPILNTKLGFKFNQDLITERFLYLFYFFAFLVLDHSKTINCFSKKKFWANSIHFFPECLNNLSFCDSINKIV
jgi:hypothetical protein